MLALVMRIFLLLILLMSSPLESQETGHATAELWLAPPRIEEGKPTVIPAAIRMVYEKGWHGYWVNPGEGGMKTEVTWKLPTGLSVGELQFPVPKREMTGELACYGYVGEVLLPVLFTVNGALPQEGDIEATVSWLACDEKGCAPGEATVKAKVASAADSLRTPEVTAAFAALPAEDENLKLHVTEADGWVTLLVTGAEQRDLQGGEIFPVTEQALDPQQPILLQKNEKGFSARVKKNEYAPSALTQLSLVIVPKPPSRALAVEWKK